MLSADMSTALVYSVNSASTSYLYQLFGNPSDYVRKISNSDYARLLPLRLRRINFHAGVDNYHALAVDYHTDVVYYADCISSTLSYGNFDDSEEYFFPSPPTSKSVSICYTRC